MNAEIQRQVPSSERYRRIRERNAIVLHLVAESRRTNPLLCPQRVRPLLRILLRELDPASSEARAVTEVLAVSSQAFTAYIARHEWAQRIISAQNERGSSAGKLGPAIFKRHTRQNDNDESNFD